jgi:hypothetical protein
MGVEISHWQNRLEKNFEELRKDRSSISSDYPIYGLEHGLGREELKSFSRAIKEKILHGPPSDDQWLVWVVYATEIGYDYAGDEYWQTFERETPGWTHYGDRYWLRKCFLWFHENYGGARPTGRWAEHFSIICWPITHAILPKDLQRQLARILFELRHSFSAQLFESPTTLGERIASRSWNATSRFQNFTEETQLVGQIGAALLLQGKFGTAGILQEATLQRISEDLDRERRAREWLRRAQKMAEKRAHIRGISFGHISPSATEFSLDKARSEVQELGIEPRLILRPKDTQRRIWDVLLEIPDFSNLMFRFPHFRDILTGSRCVVAGSSGRSLARGYCLYGSQRIALSRWPDSDEVLLQFDRADPQLEYLLRTECLLRPGSTWLFRIASDNLAYETRSLRVRPGGRYIIVNSANSMNLGEITKSINLTCEGVYSVLIELPNALTEDWEEWLRSHGIGQAKTIEVWPAGLGAVVWDGEGYGEWIASEQPCIGIRSDHSIDSIIVSMGIETDQSLEISPVTAGESFFVELPELPVGLHTVNFLTSQSTSEEKEPLGDLDVVMRIRETRPWSPGISPQGPLLVQIDPASPTLEQLWEARIELALQGPEGRQVECKLSFFENDVKTATLIKQLPPIELPVSPANWQVYFEKFFKKLKEAEVAYDAARACELYFSAEELGTFTIRCEREFTPLRWAVRRDTKGYVTRIFDDSGNSAPPKISYYSFEKPSIEEELECGFIYRVADVGGLYVARQGLLNAAVIIPPAVTVNKFSALRCFPRFVTPDRSIEAVINLISLAVLWSNARLPGDLISSLRQRDVLHEVTRQVFRIIGGEKWYEAECSYQDRKCKLLDLKKKISRRSNEKDLALFLAKNYASFANTTNRKRISQLASMAVKSLHLNSIPPERTVVSKRVIRKRPVKSAENASWLCQLAVRLACAPATTETWAGDALRAGIERLLHEPTLARAARFLVIAIDQQVGSSAITGKPYSGWEWE